MFRRITAPRMACQKPTLTWYSRSVPGSGCSSTAAPPRPPLNMLEKMSRNAAAAPLLRLRAAGFEQVGKIEAAEIERNSLAAALSAGTASESASAESSAGARVGLGRRRIDVVRVVAELVVDLALLGIAEDVVGFREQLEFFFRRLVAGIDVGMVLARQLAKRLTNLLGGGGFLHPERFVIVFGRGRHGFSCLCHPERGRTPESKDRRKPWRG